MLEWSVLNELGFKLDIVTPVRTTQSLLKLLNNQFGSQPEILTLAIQSFFTFNFSMLPTLLIAGILLARAIYLLMTIFQLPVITINFESYLRPKFYKFGDSTYTTSVDFFLFNTLNPNSYLKNLDLICYPKALELERNF